MNHWHPESERRKPLFIEWVYFKFFSEHADGIIVYGCGWGLPGVLSVQVFPRRGGQVILPPRSLVRHDYPSSQVWRSTESYDCRIDRSCIATLPRGHHIVGSISDAAHTLEWDLTFDALFPPLDAYEDHFGLCSCGHIGWRIISPLAQVSGRIAADGEVWDLRGTGYTDTNWGQWAFGIDPTTHWNWALGFDVSGSAQGLVGMNIRCRPDLGALFFLRGDEVIRFPCDAATFEHREFARDQATGVRLPVRTAVRARRPDGYRLEVELLNEAAYVYRQAIPPKEMRGPLPTPFEWGLGECLITWTGQVDTPRGERWPLSGRGIKEYPVTRLALHR